ncbi:MAG: flavodoxin-dependent (E)-4-hydroxy-3-methylbut-2-enyl-diphosphate synthase [Oscillospiraceae bacterium]|nr:flavodoxin-dependent (E)-4-hydroxy-3-methylbut-2-enyl-diphosphate synthase [Oscillospiraceae bacterium]
MSLKRKVKVGNITLGDGNIYVQSMLNVPAVDVEGNVRQAVELEKAGCDILRVSVPSIDDVHLISAIKSEISIPLVADIHFDHRIAIRCVEEGVDKLRINPGNIGSHEKVREVSDVCRRNSVPIRIGVNSGSLEKDLLEKYGSPCADALVESAIRHVRLLEEQNFYDMVISIKASSVPTMIEAYRKLDKLCDYPLHLGVTEAGTERMGVIKSAVGIGSLLCDGIGDTIRVSLTEDPVLEIKAARDILTAAGKSRNSVEIVSCPTCGRTQIDLISLTHRVEAAISGIHKNIKIAVMGCAVNGPGEAREADIGIAGGNGEGLIFKKGEIVRKVREEELLTALLNEIKMM